MTLQLTAVNNHKKGDLLTIYITGVFPNFSPIEVVGTVEHTYAVYAVAARDFQKGEVLEFDTGGNTKDICAYEGKAEDLLAYVKGLV